MTVSEEETVEEIKTGDDKIKAETSNQRERHYSHPNAKTTRVSTFTTKVSMCVCIFFPCVFSFFLVVVVVCVTKNMHVRTRTHKHTQRHKQHTHRLLLKSSNLQSPLWAVTFKI